MKAPGYSTESPALLVRDLVKSYGRVRALDGVGFEVSRGEVVGFLGPNGAGKSTTLRIISGLLPADSGEVHVCGISVARTPLLVRKHFGYMPENNPLPAEMRVKDYLRFRGRLKGLSGRELERQVSESLSACDLSAKTAGKLIGTLSKGFRQRVGVADAILARPDVVVMDEPTIGLDPHQILAMRSLVNSLRSRMTLMLSSHILPEIEMCCDRVIIINQGRVVASGSPQHLRKEFVTSHVYQMVTDCPEPVLAQLIARMQPNLTVQLAGSRTADAAPLQRFEWASADGFALSDLVETLALRKYRVAQAFHVEPSLEDVFLAATRRTWDSESLMLKESRAV